MVLRCLFKYKIESFVGNFDFTVSVGISEGAQTAEFSDLASELKILIHVGEHKNIVNLLGACTKSERLMIIMEYAPHGNLLKFLRSKREIYEPIWITTTNNPDVELTIRNLVAFSYQISRGMEFLASRKVRTNLWSSFEFIFRDRGGGGAGRAIALPLFGLG